MTNIVENSDITVNVSVKQSDGITAYDLTGTSIRFAVYQKKETPIQIFEDGDVTRVSVPGGTIKVYLDRANLNNLKEDSKLYAELELRVADSNFAGSVQVLKVTGIDLGTVKNSVL